MSSTALLAEFRASRSETAFGELAQRYTNFVYSIAKRHLSNPSLAEEVAQTVFARLAQAPPKLKCDAELTAWLHRTTVHVSIDLWRSETRRRLREQHAATMQPETSADNALWDQLAPVLDQALDRLQGQDRQALLVRFFERKPMREVGQTLGVSEDAAKMRVSRALDRLRSLLSLEGVACGTVALGAILLERSLEAAPAPLLAQTTASGLLVASPGAVSGTAFLPASSHLAVGLAGLALLTVTVWLFVRSVREHRSPAAQEVIAAAAVSSGPDRGQASLVSRPAQFRAAPLTVPEVERLVLHVLDAESGEGLGGAKIHMAYFYAGGRGEAHDSLTDPSGSAGLPEPLEANAKGANVFVVADHHVPKVFRLEEQDPRREYTLRLDPARAIGGKVIDEQGTVVWGVKIRLQSGHGRSGGPEHPDFQLCSATTDPSGHWEFGYIPKDYDEARLILTKDDFAVTIVDVPLTQANSTNVVLIAERGFAVVGRVIGPEGQPVSGAKIRELNNTGYRQQSTVSDASGKFILTGTGQFDSYTTTAPRIGSDGVLTIRGLNPSGEAHVVLTVEADGLTPQARTITLLAPTNSVDVRLAPGCVFRGIIVDPEGNPIPNAVVRTDADNHGLVRFRWSTQTDADGRFSWNAAPAEPTLFWFEAEGYQVQRGVLLVADGTEHRIQMQK